MTLQEFIQYLETTAPQMTAGKNDDEWACGFMDGSRNERMNIIKQLKKLEE